MTVAGWTVTFGTAMRGLDGPQPIAIPNVTVNPATASVTVLLYNGPLLCGFNVPIKRLTLRYSHVSQALHNIMACNCATDE